ncbi:circular bacteriocin, circularin A/uberolysin family [Ligilactobacillus animalis]|uniref:uberolysin/carnocyclin family circular bacteriocin n=1 Tax=Ligilactobacillus animalis TaxID=1605 RepID=UPI0010CA56E5|nr:uberolysin/carnocyclin family circular bacteriocin [Ligilactobacillus animalis]MDY2992695.1 uberolysin/carnocyclin family circular bacteriocin [Ligilactobacillus animalis]QCQ04638.1 circular bacteriocin, circularin A/uberolysin family [Ligilactobacillus animalis]
MLTTIIQVAGALGIPAATANTVVSIILNAGTVVTVLGVISTIASSGATALLTAGWAGFKATVKALAKKSMARAVAY